MPQLVLDPSVVDKAIQQWTPTEPLSIAVRKFGFVPDIGLWRPGDLLLFSKVQKNFLQRAIVKTQQRSFDAEHARWHHAAVYIGDFRICEATLTGVSVQEIYNYVPGHLIRARRCPILANDLEGSYDVVVAALIRLNRWYSMAAAISVWSRSLWGSLGKLHYGFAGPRSHICSHLYADSFSQATKRPLKNGGGSIPTPAHLSAATELKDVASNWRRIVA